MRTSICHDATRLPRGHPSLPPTVILGPHFPFEQQCLQCRNSSTSTCVWSIYSHLPMTRFRRFFRASFVAILGACTRRCSLLSVCMGLYCPWWGVFLIPALCLFCHTRTAYAFHPHRTELYSCAMTLFWSLNGVASVQNCAAALYQDGTSGTHMRSTAAAYAATAYQDISSVMLCQHD